MRLSLRDYKQKIKSIQSVLKVTKAIHLMSAIKVRTHKNQLMNVRKFCANIDELVQQMIDHNISHCYYNHDVGVSKKRVTVLFITSDKGLCGALNSRIIALMNQCLQNYSDYELVLHPIGIKGIDFLNKKDVNCKEKYAYFFNDFSYDKSLKIFQDIVQDYLDNRVEKVLVVYNRFYSVLKQEPTIIELLPKEKPVQTEEKSFEKFYYESNKVQILDHLLLFQMKLDIYKILLESYVSELSSRMVSMDMANKNSKKLWNELVFKFNQQRQSAVTQEITELISGLLID